MKISELEEQLEHLKLTHGDLELMIASTPKGWYTGGQGLWRVFVMRELWMRGKYAVLEGEEGNFKSRVNPPSNPE